MRSSYSPLGGLRRVEHSRADDVIMALWPFRRKAGRKRARSGTTFSDADDGGGIGANSTVDESRDGTLTRKSTLKKRRTDSGRPMQSHDRAPSYSPGREDVIGVRRSNRRSVTEPTHSNKGRGKGKEVGRRQSRRSREDESWERAPTLHKSVGPRKKSSKRRREDHDREEEIRAMVNTMPKRVFSDMPLGSRPSKKESKRIKTGLGFGRSGNNSPESDLSLAMAVSLDSSLSADSDIFAYKVGQIDALAPRPTLRCTVSPRWAPPSGGLGPGRTSSQRRRLADRPIPEATLKAHKRVHELADDLDASDLRELMERDNRRRERKRQSEQERLERRLARSAEKQRAAEEESAREGTPPPQNLERGVLGREVVGLGINTTSAVVTSSKRRPSETAGGLKEFENPSLPFNVQDLEAAESHQRPLNKFHRISSIPLESQSPAEEKNNVPEAPRVHNFENEAVDSVEDLVSASAHSAKHSGFFRTKKTRSKQSLDANKSRSTLSPPPPPPLLTDSDEIDSTPPRKSEGSSKGRLSLSSLFKWSNRRRRSSGGRASFSNTSREEEVGAAVQHQSQSAAALSASQSSSTAANPTLASAPASDPQPPPVPASAAAMPAGPKRSVSGSVPKRTRSRFREDLDDFPMSPPDSRTNSPEAEPVLEPLVEQSTREQASSPPSQMPARFDTPTSGHRTLDESMRTPTSPTFQNVSPEPPQSVSLASIDSEASWLSGRLTGRPYAGLQNQHGRDHSLDTGNSSAEDEPMRTPIAEGEMKWGSVRARHSHAKVVRQGEGDGVYPDVDRRQHLKSQEGLLKTFGDGLEDEVDSEGDDTVDDDGEGTTEGLQRATSVNLGKSHARHISAGSAKLLELSPRESLDSRRRSSSAAVFI